MRASNLPPCSARARPDCSKRSIRAGRSLLINSLRRNHASLTSSGPEISPEACCNEARNLATCCASIFSICSTTPSCGAEAPTFRSREEAPPSLLSLERIVVTIKTLHHTTILGVDPIHLPYPKRTGGAYRNPSQVNPSCFQVPRDNCSYQIARRAAAYPLLSRVVASWKAR